MERPDFRSLAWLTFAGLECLRSQNLRVEVGISGIYKWPTSRPKLQYHRNPACRFILTQLGIIHTA
jgi:hypothetical protein